jgi:hypothetical protein
VLSSYEPHCLLRRNFSQDVARIILATEILYIKAAFLEADFNAVADRPFFGHGQVLHITTVSDVYEAVYANTQKCIHDGNLTTAIVVKVQINDLGTLISSWGATQSEQDERPAEHKLHPAHVGNVAFRSSLTFQG